MKTCSHCGAPLELGDAIFCPYCGLQRHLDGPRLAEAISIETVGDVATPILPYGSRLPASFSDVFSTCQDHQETVQIHLVVGNSPKASGNRSLLNLTLPLVQRRAQAGVPRVEFTLRVDAEGHLGVEVLEKETDNSYRRDDLLVAVAVPAR